MGFQYVNTRCLLNK